jgi:hypothetical protein
MLDLRLEYLTTFAIFLWRTKKEPDMRFYTLDSSFYIARKVASIFETISLIWVSTSTMISLAF